MKTKLFFATLISACIILVGGCMKKGGYGDVRILMRDAPASYGQVKVEILKVRIQMNNGAWADLPTHTGIYNLLALQNGIDTTIVNTTQLPEGQISQMRLVLGTHNSIMDNGVIYDLTVPSGSETGIKLVGDIPVPANSSINVMLDFDAGASIVTTGHGSYQLKPVIKVVQ